MDYKFKHRYPQKLDSLFDEFVAKSEFEQSITPSYDKLFHDIKLLVKSLKLPSTITPESAIEYNHESELQSRVLSFNHLLRMSGRTKDNCFFSNFHNYFGKEIRKGLNNDFGGISPIQKFDILQKSLKVNEYLNKEYPAQKFSLDFDNKLIQFKEVSGVPLAIIDLDVSAGKFLKQTSSGVLLRNTEEKNIGIAVVNSQTSSTSKAESILATIQHEYVHACNTYTLDIVKSEEVIPKRAKILRTFRDEYMAYEMTDNTLGDDIDWVNRAFFYLKQDDPDYKELSNISTSWMHVMERSLFKNTKDKWLGFAIRNYLFFHAKKIVDIDLNNLETLKKINEISGIDILAI